MKKTFLIHCLSIILLAFNAQSRDKEDTDQSHLNSLGNIPQLKITYTPDIVFADSKDPELHKEAIRNNPRYRIISDTLGLFEYETISPYDPTSDEEEIIEEILKKNGIELPEDDDGKTVFLTPTAAKDIPQSLLEKMIKGMEFDLTDELEPLNQEEKKCVETELNILKAEAARRNK